jgi:hypothetical protein
MHCIARTMAAPHRAAPHRTPLAGVRVRVEIMGSQTCRIVGKSQPVFIMINPIIFTRTRTLNGCCQCRARWLTAWWYRPWGADAGGTFGCNQGCPGGCVEDTVSCASCVAYYIPGDPHAGCASDIKCVCRKP